MRGFIYFFFYSVLFATLQSEEVNLKHKDIEGLLNQYCFECHDETAKGGLNLDLVGTDLSQAKNLDHWVSIFDQIEQGQMPPKKKSQPTKREKQAFLGALKSSLHRAHDQSKGTVLRRLNGKEYENTLNDLFGTNLDLATRFPEDGRSHEFDNVGKALSISMSQMQSYLSSIDLVLEASVAKKTKKQKSEVKRYRYQDVKGNQNFYGKQWLETPDGATVFFIRRGYPSGMLKNASIRTSGYYKIRVSGYAMQTQSPITFSIGGATYQRGVPSKNFGYYKMPVGGPSQIHTVEIKTWVDRNFMVQVEPWGLSDPKFELKKNIQDYKGAGLAISHIEVEGPIIKEFPSRGHKLLFRHIDRPEIEPRNPKDKLKSWYKPKFELKPVYGDKSMQSALLAVAQRAFRRPVQSSEIQPYFSLYQSELEKGNSMEDAYKSAVAAIFCSTDFLYFNENKGALSSYALAARLSYFLNRTFPDDIMRGLLESKKLKGDILMNETKRLLYNKKFDRFIEDFSDTWLGLRDIEFTSPDRTLFPEFDSYLKHSMVDETRLFLKELILRNLSVSSIVKSDFVMLNERLAEHYEIEGSHSAKIKPVKMKPDSIRGGLITQGSILKVSANGTNTSPVVRGVWLLERIMGITPRPPPPGVPGVEPDIRGATTLREILDQHRDKDSCRSCHQLIDPPGFALENFNPIGGWRDNFRSLGEGARVNKCLNGFKVKYKKGQPVDASCELPSGEKFESFQAYRDNLAQQKELLAKAFVKKLLIFGTGREMGFSDRMEIERMVKNTAPKYGMRDLLFEVVKSKIFSHK